MRYLIIPAIALSLLAGAVSPAHADSRHEKNGRHERRWDDRDHAHRDRHVHRHIDRHRDHRWDGRDHRHDRHYSHPGRFRVGSYYRPHGYRYYAWRRGDRLPVAYYGPRYIVRDYRAYRLYDPPRGYHWVRVDNDVVLAAITTGIVVSVFNNMFY